MGNFIDIKLLIRTLLISILSLVSFWLFQQKLYFTSILFIGLIFLFLLEINLFVHKKIREVHKTISAMLKEDFSLKSPSINENDLFKDLAKLYEKQKRNHFEQQSVKIIYDNILNSISTGILILRKAQENDWELFLMNREFASILQIPIYSSWNSFKRNVSEFHQKLEENQYQEIQEIIEVSVDNQENQTFVLKTSAIKTYNYEYYIATLDSIQSIVEKKEKQAWHDLMRVISHEMMNTLTPINSLISSLEYFSEKEEWSPDDKYDFEESLKTIQKKTVYMLEFVDNYRQLANLPQARKMEVDLVALVEGCVEVMKTILEENHIQIICDFLVKELIFSIDPVLTERVIINLITNSIHALNGKNSDKIITIRVYPQAPRVCIEVLDNGWGIDKEIRNKIFIPFFTTRKEGAGIGLSLSRNIMEAQNGRLTFKSKPGETVFTMSFL